MSATPTAQPRLTQITKSVLARLLVCSLACAALCAPCALATPTEEVLYSWPASPGGPQGKLIQGSDGNFYGTTDAGGAKACGTVFKMTQAGTVTTLVDFTGISGNNIGESPSAGLIQGSDGNFYGTTYYGGMADGSLGYGTVFKMTPAGVLTTLVKFTGTSGTSKGAHPSAELVQGSDGNFYGTTTEGGASNTGTVFKMKPTGVLTTLVEFTGTGGTMKGALPYAGLVQGSDGSFYGTTVSGGVHDYGTVFKMTPAGALTTLVQFTKKTGLNPNAGLVQGSGGNFFGTTSSGGIHKNGTVFKMTSAGVLTTLVEFTGTKGTQKGSAPQTELVQGSDGNFYGTTTYGGAGGFGTTFKMTPAGVLTTLVEFTGTSGTGIGAYPAAGLAQGHDGNFYGTTQNGGASDDGTIFKMTPAGVLTTLDQFKVDPAGSLPLAGLVQGNDGNFYGTTYEGGAHDCGTVFKVTPAGVLTKLVQFTGNGATNKGRKPGRLVLGSDGNFYGTTESGGAVDYGTVFQMTPAGVLTTLVQFDDITTKGMSPYAGLVQGSDGNFYGTTHDGGATFSGTVFQMTPAGVLTTLVEFTGNGASNKGAQPAGVLVKGSDGNFYGTTSQGGANGYGTVFQMTLAGVLTTLVECMDTTTGLYPQAGLVQGTDSSFYGTAPNGYASNGTVFKTTSAGVVTPLVRFSEVSPSGAEPYAGLVQGSDGNFYGSTLLGGVEDCGTIFQMTPAGALTTLVDFTGGNGRGPRGTLVQGTDGNFYGTTGSGGPGNLGTVFRLRFGPQPQTRAATAVTSATATLHGRIHPNGNDTTVKFLYGTAADLSGAPSISVGTAPASVPYQDFAFTVNGLTPGTQYYFCIVGQNAENAQPQQGKILSFTTAP